jgi:hypothetical protein
MRIVWARNPLGKSRRKMNRRSRWMPSREKALTKLRPKVSYFQEGREHNLQQG